MWHCQIDSLSLKCNSLWLNFELQRSKIHQKIHFYNFKKVCSINYIFTSTHKQHVIVFHLPNLSAVKSLSEPVIIRYSSLTTIRMAFAIFLVLRTFNRKVEGFIAITCFERVYFSGKWFYRERPNETQNWFMIFPLYFYCQYFDLMPKKLNDF